MLVGLGKKTMSQELYNDDVVTKDDDDDVVLENQEIIEDIDKFDPTTIVVYSRDWTIETIFSQLTNANIDLNPAYQRRNAWTDEKRSKLIESIIIGYPVPEIVLAEDPLKKKSFAVIDGKQRLLAIAGFIDPDEYKYWDRPSLGNLTVNEHLNGVSYRDLMEQAKYSGELRQFLNSSLRCTIITNFEKNDVLYDIFYRLNSGSVSLSTQELRQVLNRGEFANYLIEVTNSIQPIHSVMNLKEPDRRLRDVEVILRCIAIIMFTADYKGNLKQFLDSSMAKITKDWAVSQRPVEGIYSDMNQAIGILAESLGGYLKVGRKWTVDKWESRFNRVLLEVQLFFFVNLDPRVATTDAKERFRDGFMKLCEDSDFRSSIESTTKTLENYQIRFQKFQALVNSAFETEIQVQSFR